MFPDFDKETNDDYNEDNYDSTQDHAHRICYSIKRFYKTDVQKKLFRNILSLVDISASFKTQTGLTLNL